LFRRGSKRQAEATEKEESYCHLSTKECDIRMIVLFIQKNPD
jgi:hypothetical protein